MNIELATSNDILAILEILKQRCQWLKQNKIEQWGDYYTQLYNRDYFMKMITLYELYIVKQEQEIIGAFLLKTEDKNYWKDSKKAYYIHHFVTKLGYPNLGTKMLNFIENLARQNSIHYLRLDCIKTNQKLNEYYQSRGFKNKGEGQLENSYYSYRLWEKIV